MSYYLVSMCCYFLFLYLSYVPVLFLRIIGPTAAVHINNKLNNNNYLLLFLLTTLNMLPYRNPLWSLDNILSKVH